jgi:hypothetical protein
MSEWFRWHPEAETEMANAKWRIHVGTYFKILAQVIPPMRELYGTGYSE